MWPATHTFSSLCEDVPEVEVPHAHVCTAWGPGGLLVYGSRMLVCEPWRSTWGGTYLTPGLP